MLEEKGKNIGPTNPRLIAGSEDYAKAFNLDPKYHLTQDDIAILKNLGKFPTS